MALSKEKLNFIPIMTPDYIYFLREEENGFYRIKTRLSNNSEKIINSTCYEIINMLDGINSVEEILNQLTQIYTEVSRDQLEKDLENIILKLNQFKAFKNENNPFMKLIFSNISQLHKLVYCNYNLENKVIKYLNTLKESFVSIEYNNPISYFSVDTILKKQISGILMNNVYAYYVEKNNEICGLIIWKELSSNKFVLDTLIATESNLNYLKFINNSLVMTMKIIHNNKILARINISDMEWDKKLESIIKKMNFVLTAFLANELGINKDIKEYTTYYE